MRVVESLIMAVVVTLAAVALVACNAAGASSAGQRPVVAEARRTEATAPAAGDTGRVEPRTPAQTAGPESATRHARPAQARPDATPPLAPAGDGSADRVQELLSQARNALGGEAKLQEIQSLTATGQLRRVSGDVDRSGDIKLDLFLPDKFRTTETIHPMEGIDISLVRTLNGNQAWTDSKSSSTASNSRVMILPPKNGVQNSEANQLKGMSEEFVRYTLAMLLTAPPSFQLAFSYVGEAVAADGRADVIEAKMADGLTLRLFLDRTTHRPLMMSYRGAVSRMVTKKSTASSPADIDKVIKEKQKENPAETAQRPETDIQLSLSDYRSVGGIMLPHRLTRSADGKVYEELEIAKFKLNAPELKPQSFNKK